MSYSSILNFISVITAVISAYLWWKASRVPTPLKITAIIIDDETGFEGELSDLLIRINEQSQLNAHAATAAGVTALLQACVFLLQ